MSDRQIDVTLGHYERTAIHMSCQCWAQQVDVVRNNPAQVAASSLPVSPFLEKVEAFLCMESGCGRNVSGVMEQQKPPNNDADLSNQARTPTITQETLKRLEMRMIGLIMVHICYAVCNTSQA